MGKLKGGVGAAGDGDTVMGLRRDMDTAWLRSADLDLDGEDSVEGVRPKGNHAEKVC
jgi:hypothetical protein